LNRGNEKRKEKKNCLLFVERDIFLFLLLLGWESVSVRVIQLLPNVGLELLFGQLDVPLGLLVELLGLLLNLHFVIVAVLSILVLVLITLLLITALGSIKFIRVKLVQALGVPQSKCQKQKSG